MGLPLSTGRLGTPNRDVDDARRKRVQKTGEWHSACPIQTKLFGAAAPPGPNCVRTDTIVSEDPAVMTLPHERPNQRRTRHPRFVATTTASGAAVTLSVFGATLILVIGCPGAAPPPGPPANGAALYNNTTDRTNRGARYLGAQACAACHPDVATAHATHGHARILNRVQGDAPDYPPVGSRAVVPNPPSGFSWDDIAYVIGGYTKRALFINTDGYILTNDAEGVDTQWDLLIKAAGIAFDFVPYEDDGDFSPGEMQPFNFSCFVCHTTGPLPQDPANPMFQESRPGFVGTWMEAGVQCEACHGPGSNHVPNPSARDLFVDTSARFCGECHNQPYGSDPSVITADAGYIGYGEQYSELLASGGHAGFDCLTCHRVHDSTVFDRNEGIHRTCQSCHDDMNMALHEGAVFFRDDYSETLSCESCHMPFAVKNGSAASAAVVGDLGRMGNGRSHVFRVNVNEVSFTNMFSDDMTSVRQDESGRAAVTLDFVCVRCHNGIGNAFAMTEASAKEIAFNVHGFAMGMEASRQASERTGPQE